jgi:hypothetical protein
LFVAAVLLAVRLALDDLLAGYPLLERQLAPGAVGGRAAEDRGLVHDRVLVELLPGRRVAPPGLAPLDDQLRVATEGRLVVLEPGAGDRLDLPGRSRFSWLRIRIVVSPGGFAPPPASGNAPIPSKMPGGGLPSRIGVPCWSMTW